MVDIHSIEQSFSRFEPQWHSKFGLICIFDVLHADMSALSRETDLIDVSVCAWNPVKNRLLQTRCWVLRSKNSRRFFTRKESLTESQNIGCSHFRHPTHVLYHPGRKNFLHLIVVLPLEIVPEQHMVLRSYLEALSFTFFWKPVGHYSRVVPVPKDHALNHSAECLKCVEKPCRPLSTQLPPHSPSIHSHLRLQLRFLVENAYSDAFTLDHE